VHFGEHGDGPAVVKGSNQARNGGIRAGHPGLAPDVKAIERSRESRLTKKYMWYTFRTNRTAASIRRMERRGNNVIPWRARRRFQTARRETRCPANSATTAG